jgi:hypothetical protein
VLNKSYLRSLSVVLIALLLLQSVISLFVYDVKLKQIKRSVKWAYLNERSKDELVLVKVAKSLEASSNTFFSRVHAKEFEFLGEMYDIVCQSDKGDTTYYYCFHDREETQLAKKIHAQLINLLAQNNSTSKQEKKAWDFYQLKYLPIDYWQSAAIPVSVTTLLCAYNPIILSGHLSIKSPPPDFSA